MRDENKPWVSNYPPLQRWLDEQGARPMWQVPYGPRDAPSMYVEGWSVDGRLCVITVHANKGGWDIYTAADTNSISETLADATARLRPPARKG